MSTQTTRAEPKSTAIDPEKITGPYPLMAVLLIVVEGLLGYWLYASDGSAERITAGVLMTLIFAGVMVVIVLLQRPAEAAVRLPGVDEVKPASREIELAEAENPPPDVIASPDRSYVISKPPPNWALSELTPAEYLAVMLDVRPDALPPFMPTPATGAREILMFRGPHTLTITPIPGATRVDGRLLPTALQTPAPTTLAIMPLERALPPLFVERPFEHNFHVAVGQLMTAGLITLRRTEAGRVSSTGRRFLLADFRQDLENVMIDNQQHPKASLNISVIGIEGDIGDFLLVSRYAQVVPSSADRETDLLHLKQLIDSFRPIKLSDQTTSLKRLRDKADDNYGKLLDQYGEDMFFTELLAFAARLRSMNLDDPADRLKIMEALRPFEMFAEAIGANELDDLWEALRTAEKGDATGFKEKIVQLMSRLETAETAVSSTGQLDSDERPVGQTQQRLEPPKT